MVIDAGGKNIGLAFAVSILLASVSSRFLKHTKFFKVTFILDHNGINLPDYHSNWNDGLWIRRKRVPGCTAATRSEQHTDSHHSRLWLNRLRSNKVGEWKHVMPSIGIPARSYEDA